jgi:hypothetical protein
VQISVSVVLRTQHTNLVVVSGDCAFEFGGVDPGDEIFHVPLVTPAYIRLEVSELEVRFTV